MQGAAATPAARLASPHSSLPPLPPAAGACRTLTTYDQGRGRPLPPSGWTAVQWAAVPCAPFFFNETIHLRVLHGAVQAVAVGARWSAAPAGCMTCPHCMCLASQQCAGGNDYFQQLIFSGFTEPVAAATLNGQALRPAAAAHW